MHHPCIRPPHIRRLRRPRHLSNVSASANFFLLLRFPLGRGGRFWRSNDSVPHNSRDFGSRHPTSLLSSRPHFPLRVYSMIRFGKNNGQGRHWRIRIETGEYAEILVPPVSFHSSQSMILCSRFRPGLGTRKIIVVANYFVIPPSASLSPLLLLFLHTFP